MVTARVYLVHMGESMKNVRIHILKLVRILSGDAGFVKVSEWCEVMSSIFTMQLPWHSLRSKLAKVNSAGLVDYRSTFDDFKLQLKHNPEVRMHSDIRRHASYRQR